MEQGGEKIRKLGRIVEHQFGTLKVRNGFHQFLMWGLEECRGEFSLMTLTYNFTRVLNILGVERIQGVLRRAKGTWPASGLRSGEKIR